MKKLVFIILLISLCIISFAKKSVKKDVSEFPSKPYKRLNRKINYYVNSGEISAEINRTLRAISFVTCIEFTKQKKPVQNSGINFYLSKSKSDIILDDGKKKPTNIYLKIFNSTCDHQLLFLYIGLALGLIPETTRYDRDKYVNVLSENIDNSYKKYYKKTSKKIKYYTEFDYGSAMFFKAKFGSKNKKPTYKYKLYPYYEDVIGKSGSFSHSDFKVLNKLYCKKCYKNCKNGGYPQKRCAFCQCQPHFEGKFCEKLPLNKDKECGFKNELKSHKNEKTLKISNVKGQCYYKIKSSNKKKIAIKVKSLKIKGNYCNGIAGLFVYYRKDKTVAPLYLCNNVTEVSLPPSSDTVYIALHSHVLTKELTISYKNA